MTNVQQLVVAARTGDAEAIRALSAMAARSLSERTPMPDELADYLAFTFRRMAGAQAKANGRTVQQVMITEFANGLGLKRPANRPRMPTPDAEITLAIAMFGETLSQTEIATALVETTGLGIRAAQKRVEDSKLRIAKGEAVIWDAYVKGRIAASRSA